MVGQARRFHPTSTIFSPIIPHLLADPERAGDQATLSGIHPLSLQDEGGHFLILPASFVKVPAPDTKKFYDLPHAFLLRGGSQLDKELLGGPGYPPPGARRPRAHPARGGNVCRGCYQLLCGATRWRAVDCARDPWTQRRRAFAPGKRGRRCPGVCSNLPAPAASSKGQATPTRTHNTGLLPDHRGSSRWHGGQ